MQHAQPRPSAGQASSEYVGLLAVVALVATAAAAGAAGVGAPALLDRIAAALRHGVCTVAGGICTPAQAREAGLAPCVVRLRTDEETLGAVVAVVRLRRGDTVVVERRSDGGATVSFLDSNGTGAETGIGLQLAALSAEGAATAAAGVTFNTGRSYEFGSWGAARRFLARHAREETGAGEALNLARRLSPLHEPRRLPVPDATSFEAGTWAQLEAELEVPLPRLERRLDGEAGAQVARVLGRRRSGSDSTWYLALDDRASAQLGLVIGAVGATARREAVLEVTTRDGRPTAAAITSTAALAGELSLYGHSTDLARLAERLGRATAGARAGGQGGTALQARVALDLQAAANRAAVLGVLDVLRLRAAPAAWPDRLRALGERLDRDGAIDVSVFRTSSSADDQSLALALGAKVGLERVRSRHARELVAAWSARGGPLREREDCLATAPA